MVPWQERQSKWLVLLACSTADRQSYPSAAAAAYGEPIHDHRQIIHIGKGWIEFRQTPSNHSSFIHRNVERCGVVLSSGPAVWRTNTIQSIFQLFGRYRVDEDETRVTAKQSAQKSRLANFQGRYQKMREIVYLSSARNQFRSLGALESSLRLNSRGSTFSRRQRFGIGIEKRLEWGEWTARKGIRYWNPLHHQIGRRMRIEE